MNTFPLSRPLTLDEFVKGYADGGEVEATMPFDFDAGLGTGKPLMQELYERGMVSEGEYLDWLASQEEGGREQIMPMEDTEQLEEFDYTSEYALPISENEPIEELAQKYEVPALNFMGAGYTGPMPTGGSLDAGQKAMALASLIDADALRGF
jgi:hypothetical protein